MKWYDLARVPEGSLLVRAGSDRKVILLEKSGPPTSRITIKWLDTRQIERGVNPADFDLPKPPEGTVARN